MGVVAQTEGRYAWGDIRIRKDQQREDKQPLILFVRCGEKGGYQWARRVIRVEGRNQSAWGVPEQERTIRTEEVSVIGALAVQSWPGEGP